jgi:hypothetical protein
LEKVNAPTGFNEMEDESIIIPEGLKEIIMNEIDSIRNALTVAGLYMGEPIPVLLKLLQELDPDWHK